MSQVSSASVIQLFKKVYGDINDVIPSGLPMMEEIPFSEKEKVGDKYVEAVTLTSEVGITYGGTAGDIFDINPAVAGAVRQAEVAPYMSVLASVIPWGVISRSVGGGEKAFADATKHVVKNNIKSHMTLLEIAMLYGQDDIHLGRVTYAPSGTVYRGATYSGNGNITLVSALFGSIAFTAGINAVGKYILFQPGDFASGIWVNNQGIKVKQLNSSNQVVAEGKLVAYDSALGIIKVDFTPVAASGIGSHTLAFDGMEDAKEMVGMKKILRNTGSLFGINAATYPLWSGNVVVLSAVKLTLARVLSTLADAVNKGGISGDLVAYCNPRSFQTIISDEAALRRYPNQGDVDNGASEITFHYQEGVVRFKPSRFVMEGECYILTKEDWLRSGSAQVSFTVPGMPQEVIFPLENQSGHMFRSFSDQYVFCRAPARQILIRGINDESAT